MITFGVFAAVLFALFTSSLILRFIDKNEVHRRIAGGVAILTGVLVGLPLLAVLALFSLFALDEATVPSLHSLQTHFSQRQPDLQRLVLMSDQDPDFSRIDPGWTYQMTQQGKPMSKQSMYGDADAQLPKGRWDTYRFLFSKNGIKLGIQRNTARDAFVMINSAGLLDRGHIAGYVFCASSFSTDVSRYEPCRSRLSSDSAREKENPHAEGYAFQKLTDHWYAFDQGPG